MSMDVALLPHFGEVISNLADEWRWELIGDDIDTITQAVQNSVNQWYSNMLVGLVGMFAVSLPLGWLLLDGATHLKVDYPELWALLDAGMKTASDFTLPDMTDAFPMGADTVGGVGATGGANTYQLTEGQLPPHSHTYVPPVADVDLEAPGVPDILAARLGAPTTTGSTGDGDDIDNRPNYVTFQYAIFAGRE